MVTELLIQHFKNNLHVFEQNTEGISHEESLMKITADASSINWITGHITVTRDRMLELLGKQKICSSEMVEKYKRGSPVLVPESATAFDTITSLFYQSQKILVDALMDYDFTSQKELVLKISFFGFHESYHCGQLGLLRRFTGKEGKIK